MVGLMVVEVFKNATDLQLGVGYMTKILFDDMNKVIWWYDISQYRYLSYFIVIKKKNKEANYKQLTIKK